LNRLHGIVVVTAHKSAADPHILVLEQWDPDIPFEPHTPTVSAYFDNVSEIAYADNNVASFHGTRWLDVDPVLGAAVAPVALSPNVSIWMP
jgi:hypothetical protein